MRWDRQDPTEDKKGEMFVVEIGSQTTKRGMFCEATKS